MAAKDPKPRLDARGWEIPDPTPMVIHTGLKKPPTLEETIARVFRAQAANAAIHRVAGIEESLEESEDFDISDEPLDLLTKYEHAADALPVNEMRAKLAAALKEKPSLKGFIRNTFGHLFKGKELEDPPAPPASPELKPDRPPSPEGPKPSA